MLERIQNDGVAPKTATVSASARAELVVAPAPASSELREKAVAPVSNGQRSTNESDLLHPLMQVVGQVHEEMDAVAAHDAERKRLEDIYSKLFKAYGEVSSGPVPHGMETEIEKTIADLDKSLMGSDQQTGAGAAATDENAAAQAMRQQREKTLERISLALRKVGVLRNKLTDSSNASHERLVNINTSVASLNMARAQLDDSSFSITSAASAVDSVMLNLRSAVFAHGKISADVVRLVMS